MKKCFSFTELIQGLSRFPIGSKFYVEYSNQEVWDQDELEVITVVCQGERNKMLCWDSGEEVNVTTLLAEASYIPVESFKNISTTEALKLILSGETDSVYVSDHLGFRYPDKVSLELLESLEDLGKGLTFLKLTQDTNTECLKGDF